MQHLSGTRGNDGIALVTLANAAGLVNVVCAEWMDEMTEVVEQLIADSSVQGVIVTSAKRSFMVGADLKYLVQAYGVMPPGDAFELSQRASLMHRRLETGGKPFVAALNGTALGGGFELALARHYRVLADDEQVRVGLPEVTVGLLPGSGNFDALRAADLVIEAVFENGDLKADVLRKAERVMRPDALLASNTSTLPINSLAGAVTRSDNFIGLHFPSNVWRS